MEDHSASIMIGGCLRTDKDSKQMVRNNNNDAQHGQKWMFKFQRPDISFI
jgi:galactose mutarotase-like enzyme